MKLNNSLKEAAFNWHNFISVMPMFSLNYLIYDFNSHGTAYT